MTTRNRRRPIARRAGRTSRLVWANTEVQKTITSAGIQITDMLLNAGNLKHDATIARIRGWLSIAGIRTAATVGSFEIDNGLWVGSENGTIATVPDPADTSDEAAWLWKHHYFGTFIGDGTLPTATGQLNLNFPIDIKAQRRFRENFNSLFWILNMTNVGLSTATLIFKGRTLLRVP